jgi:hypothetical protein
MYQCLLIETTNDLPGIQSDINRSKQSNQLWATEWLVLVWKISLYGCGVVLRRCLRRITCGFLTGSDPIFLPCTNSPSRADAADFESPQQSSAQCLRILRIRLLLSGAKHAPPVRYPTVAHCPFPCGGLLGNCEKAVDQTTVSAPFNGPLELIILYNRLQKGHLG